MPDQQALVAWVRKSVISLGAESIERVKIYGRQTGEEIPAWNQEFELVAKTNSTPFPVSTHSSFASSKTQGVTSPINSSGKTSNHSKHSFTKNGVSNQLKPTSSQMGVYYFAGIGLIIFAVLSSSTLENPVITWSIIIFVVACLVAISTAQGQAFIAKHSQQMTEEIVNRQLSVLAESERKLQRGSLESKGLISVNEQVVFYQMATYRGGVRGYPNSAQSSGFAFVLNHSFVFYDEDMSFKVLYERVIEAKLDFFQLGGVRGFLAAGDVGRQLQQTKNILELSYVDDENTERSAKFQMNGALTIPGEAQKAVEFLNHLLEFKGKFEGKSTGSIADPVSKLEKLKKLKDQGVITELEFEAKKRELLDQL